MDVMPFLFLDLNKLHNTKKKKAVLVHKNNIEIHGELYETAKWNKGTGPISA